ncbi:response regulator transcription factor [Anaerocellum danielii]|uniref:Response regulator n=1 Tax=Anaerocellum danielii TaxID=1387557 RepID=A0ABZ0TZK8_9FIRM|nr:response regulator [Caldicellulosiruptor danielii]WPX08916.1 response regulator [Caldicellulosiruptor danielii]
MRKVLIVDDEKLIRKGIRTILERNVPDLNEIKEASNGKEALDLLLSEKFDILIIDIRLPQLDGISVLKKIQNLSYKPKIIIISGYDEFNYAKECMQYGARGYILKPIDKKELIEIVEKVKNELQEEENNFRLISLQRIMKAKMFESEVNNIIFSGMDVSKFKERLKDLEIPSDEKVIAVYLLWPGSFSEQNDFSTEEDKLRLSKMLPQGSYVSTIYNQRKDILVFAKVAFCYQEIKKNYESLTGRKLYMGICDLQESFENLKLLYERAYKAALYSFISSKEIEFWSQVAWREKEKFSKFERVEKLKEVILAGKQKEAITFLESIFNCEFFGRYSADSILAVTEKLYIHIVDWFCHHVPKKVLEIHEYQDLDSILNFTTIHDYVNHFKKFVYEATDMVTSLKGILNVKDEIDEAIKFINQNYHKDINMAMVANHVSLNYYYFSSIFKEKTGMSFLDYLNKVRVEKAKELLANTNLKVWEIAERVGYKNPKHFARIFKEITGLTPNEYRDAQKSLQE